jgi:hypothetical protein
MGLARHHLRPPEAHDEIAARHAEAADWWAARGDDVRAEFERWNASIERLSSELARMRAEETRSL